MRKYLLLALVLLSSSILFAQSRANLLNETFDSSSLPEGWTTSEEGAENWVISETNYAGGDANELSITWWPILTGTSRAITPAIDLSGISEVVVNFKHYLDNQINAYTLGIATSTDGITWNTGWSESYTTSGQYEVYQIISTPDMGKENVMFCLFFEGASYTMNGWFFDDFQISTQDKLDLAIISIDIPEMIKYDSHEVSFTVQNMGSETINSIKVKTKDLWNNEDVIHTFDTEIQSLETKQFTFPTAIYFSPGTYNLPIEIISVNDESDSDNTNNSLEKEINVGMGYAQKFPMIEHFSSSTCYYCVEANTLMEELTEANPGKYTYTKYPVNFPGTGDPYYFNEVAGRAGYYQVDAAPQLYLDGILQEYSVVSQEALDASYNNPSFANIRGAFNIEGNTINITADFMSYIKMENVRAFISVNEKVTTENVGNNGETEFHHIMMKMLDSPIGNEIDIEAGEYHRFEFSYDMSSTNVEDMNDLEVSLWLQNYETMEIYNSHYAYEYTNHCYPVQNLRSAIVGDYITLQMDWDAPEQGTPVGYNIYVNGELIEENVTDNSYENDAQLAGDLFHDEHTHIAEVVAVYEDGMTSVAATAIIDNNWTNVTETEDANVEIYPNPAKDIVKISSLSGQASVVRIYNVMGMMVDEIEVNSNNIEINVSDYTPGIYFFNVEGKTVKVIKN